jgi:hypothetical protein
MGNQGAHVQDPGPVRVEIIQELDPEDDVLEVPWSSPADPTLRYWDLKVFPEKIAELRECREFPGLGPFLAGINSPGSALRTAKCDVWSTTGLAEDERIDFNLPFKTGSYLDVVFDRAGFRERLDAHTALAAKLQDGLSALRVQGQMEIVIRRCLFHPEDVWGYALTLFVHAYGSTQAEALAEWHRAIEAVGEVLTAPL